MRFLLIFCFLLMAPQKSFALCVAPTLSGVPAAVNFSGGSGGYRVYDSGEYMQSIPFQVKSVAGIGGCKYFMVLGAGSSGSPATRRMALGGDTLDYNVYNTAAKTNIIYDNGNYGGANVLSGNFSFILGVLQTNNETLHWTVNPLQVVKSNAANFQDTPLTLDLYGELALGIYTLTDSKTITFKAQVESDIDLSLVDTGGSINLGDTAQTLNFGNLSSGAILSYDTMIRSNSGYVLSMQSANGQEMAYQGPPVNGTTIPYTLTIAGNPVDLSSGNFVQAISSTGVTDSVGERFPTQFTIGTLTGSEPAGTYQDVITVTISGN